MMALRPTRGDRPTSNSVFIVHEADSPWPAALGAPGLVVIPQQPDESMRSFSARVRRRLQACLHARATIPVAHVACGRRADAPTLAAREQIAVDIAEAIRAGGGGELIISRAATADPRPTFVLARALYEQVSDPCLEVKVRIVPPGDV